MRGRLSLILKGRETDNRHAEDQLRILEAEVQALRFELKRLQKENAIKAILIATLENEKQQTHDILTDIMLLKGRPLVS